jgi:SAM-dependent methyltransferase
MRNAGSRGIVGVAAVNAQLDPRQVLDPDRFRDYEQSTARSPLVPALLSRIDRPGLSICDVGGATGRFLDLLAHRAAHPFDGTVLDVLPDYRTHLVNPAFDFIVASIVDNALASDRFDIVTARHVLHHLVAGSVAATADLQRRGLAEMLRLARPGGHLVFQEQVHYVRPLSRAVYHLSRLASKHRLRVKTFEAGKVVVSFMTPEEIRGALADIGRSVPLSVEAYSDEPRQVALKWKLTVLMARVGDVVYAIRKGEA